MSKSGGAGAGAGGEVPEGAVPGGEVPEGAAVLPEVPPELGVHPLLLAVLHALIFLEGSDDSIVQPDAASEAVGFITAYLQRLDGPLLRQVREDLATLVEFARNQRWDRDCITYLREFLHNYGVEQESS
jgi:hypothetical protein